jgi:isopenicillin-N epimerase
MNNMPDAKTRDVKNDQDWLDLAVHWRLRSDTIYLNHGSFGLPPDAVRYARRQWINQLDEQPMDFYLRQLEPALLEAKTRVAKFLGTNRRNLIFVDNATYGMNVVANSFQLGSGDEVLINNHEYGAVKRIWQRKCDRVGAKLFCVELPERFESPDQIVNALLSGTTDKTKLLIVSHITSPTALIMPVNEICEAFTAQEIAICVDGPHAPAQIDLNIDGLDCDFYTASCHKWLCATLGSGFLYVNPRNHRVMEPPIKSWGRMLPAMPQTWDEEFTWLGTRDPSPYLSIPVAIEFMETIGLDEFRTRSRWLASYVEKNLSELFGTTPIGSPDQGWYGSMAHVPLPKGDWSLLQKQLWEQIGIEIPIINFKNRFFVRVSCHLYNNRTQLDALVKALSRLTM